MPAQTPPQRHFVRPVCPSRPGPARAVRAEPLLPHARGQAADPKMGKAAKRKRKVPAPAAAKGPVKSAMAMVKSNPFEVKVNRQKFDILGRKTKNDVGLPGVSRSKAIKKVRGHPRLGGSVASVVVAAVERG